MKELDFILLYKINRKLKNINEAKAKINLFWETLIDILHEENQIDFRHWGKFRVKKCIPRKYSSPYSHEIGYTQSKYVIKFKISSTLKKHLNLNTLNLSKGEVK